MQKFYVLVAAFAAGVVLAIGLAWLLDLSEFGSLATASGALAMLVGRQLIKDR
jgi:hypothetical protein